MEQIALHPSNPGVIVTIAREHGSAGKRIGQMVAERLGVPCYYKEMTALAAQESGLAKEFIPAVLQTMKIATDAAHRAGIWIGICGELGANLTLLETFLAIGIDELSVSPSAVLPLRAEIRKAIAETCTLEKLEC